MSGMMSNWWKKLQQNRKQRRATEAMQARQSRPQVQQMEERVVPTAGLLDTTFGSDHTGKVTTDFNSNSSDDARTMTVDSSGRILVAGHSFASNNPAIGTGNDFGLPQKKWTHG